MESASKPKTFLFRELFLLLIRNNTLLCLKKEVYKQTMMMTMMMKKVRLFFFDNFFVAFFAKDFSLGIYAQVFARASLGVDFIALSALFAFISFFGRTP